MGRDLPPETDSHQAMFNIKLLPLAALALTGGLFSCATPGAPNEAEWSGLVDQEDARTQHVLDMSAGYTSNDFGPWQAHIAEDAEIMLNDATMTRDEVIATFAAGHDAFDDIAHEDLNVTTMLYNNGTVFTNMWYTWTGTAKASGEALSIKGYCWMQWDGDKVIAIYNAFDPTRYNEVTATEG